MDTPFTMLARREPWDIFATLSFKGAEPSQGRARCMLFAWLRKLAAANRLPWTGIFWLARVEHGEIGGRLHFHVLISGLPRTANNLTRNHSARAMWESVGGGMARVYSYDTRLSGVSYVMKGLEDDGFRRHADAVAYEVGKYSQRETVNSEMLIPARALLRKWMVRLELNRRHRKAREMKTHQRDRSHRGASVVGWNPTRFPHPADMAGRSYVR